MPSIQGAGPVFPVDPKSGTTLASRNQKSLTGCGGFSNTADSLPEQVGRQKYKPVVYKKKCPNPKSDKSPEFERGTDWD